MNDGYKQIRQRLQDFYEEKDFENALIVAREICEKFPEHHVAAYFNLAYMQAALNMVEETISTLEESYEKGSWWAEDTINQFPNYEAMKADPRFQELQKKYLLRYEEEKKKTKLKVAIREPNDHDPDKPAPLLIALHWGGSTAEEFEPYWKDGVLSAGVLLALPQSPQLSGPNSYTWMNLEQGLQDLEKAYLEITEKYSVETGNVFLAGASIGGTLALEAAFVQQKFPVKGVVAVIPYDIKPDQLVASIDRASGQKIKCCLVTGTKDGSYESCKELFKLLQGRGMESRFYESVGAGHIIPPDFDKILGETMNFLLN